MAAKSVFIISGFSTKDCNMQDVIWAANAVNKLRRLASVAKNQKFVDFWNETADKLEVKYLTGQPWLRTYDGKLQ